MNKALVDLRLWNARHWSHHARNTLHKHDDDLTLKCLHRIESYIAEARQELMSLPKILTVRDDMIFYGGKETILMGNCPRQLLPAEIKPGAIDTDIEKEIGRYKTHGLNYWRIDAYEDYDRTANFCATVAELNHVVQLTLAGAANPKVGDYKEHVNRTKHLPNMIYEVLNEFMDEYDDVIDARIKASWIKSQGLLVSGGAWGNSNRGDENAKNFRRSNLHRINDMHRPYGGDMPIVHFLDYIKELKKEGKPILWNEILLQIPNFPCLDETELEYYIREGIKVGLNGACVYTGEFHELLGSLCRGYNE